MWWSGRNGVLELRAKSLGKREREEGGLVKKEREGEGDNVLGIREERSETISSDCERF